MSASVERRMELEPASTPLEIHPDRRTKIEEPPPVQLVAIADVMLLATHGLERELVDFYVRLLRFERDPAEPGLVFRAENARLRFTLNEAPLPREQYRLLGIVVASLSELTRQLDDREIPYVLQRGVATVQKTIMMSDPAGNMLEISDAQRLL